MKYLLFFILLTSCLFSKAQDNTTINELTKEEQQKKIHKTAEDKHDDIDKLFISENGQEYKKIYYDRDKKKIVKDFSLKMIINKDRLQEETRYLTVITDINTLKNTNANYFIKDHMIIIKLNSSTPEILYFNFIYDKPKRIAFRFNVISDFEYTYILPFEGILYGLSYGIIFCAFIYYMAIFFSTKNIAFLFYSFMQFFVLLSLIGFVYASFRPYTNNIEKPIIDILETLSFIFTFLFAKNILNTKKEMPFINHLLSFFVLLNIADVLATLIFEYSIFYVDSFFFINFLFPAIAGVIAVYKGNKYAIFYTLGWFIVFCSVYAYELDIIPLSGIYTIHLAAPMESLIFSFALAYMLKDLIKKQNEQEKLLIHKSKLASMGEMIDNIAHQWRQPLAHLGYINMNLEVASANNQFEQEYFVKKIKESNGQIKFMSKTIEDFGDFYKPEKKRHEFSILSACELAINIISPTLKKKNITLNLNIENDSKIKAYENEYAQVILNLLTNCIDIFAIRKIQNPIIDIKIDKINHKTITKVYDNAGGIDKKYLENIFEANFTTKQRGSGIGLYMSKVIIQSHFKGDIYVSNKNKGACFSIEV